MNCIFTHYFRTEDTLLVPPPEIKQQYINFMIGKFQFLFNRKNPEYNTANQFYTFGQFFGEYGKSVGFETFLTGFLPDDRKFQFSRPAGIAIARDGSLLCTEDTPGILYRVIYSKE
jgi:hypothetical protein